MYEDAAARSRTTVPPHRPIESPCGRGDLPDAATSEALNGDGVNPLMHGAMRRATRAPQWTGGTPLERLAAPLQSRIAGCLTIDEALTLMWVSQALNEAAGRDTRLNAYRNCVAARTEVIRSLHSIGARLGAIQMRPLPATDVVSSGAQTFMQRLRAIRAKPVPAFDVHAAERSRLLGDRQLQRHELLCFVEKIEHVAFHSVGSQTASVPSATSSSNKYSHLHYSIRDGHVAEVARFVKEFLALPPQWLSTERKVDWLRDARGMCTLAFFGQYSCGPLDARERNQNDAIRAYVAAVAGSSFLSLTQKTGLLIDIRREIAECAGIAPRVVECHIPHRAMWYQNPVVAAAVVLGIIESEAAPNDRAELIRSAARPWHGDFGACIDAIQGGLTVVRERAPEWVSQWIARLEVAKQPEGFETSLACAAACEVASSSADRH